MENNVVVINNQDLQIKIWDNEKVLTFKDIDTFHQRPDGTAGRAFRQNKQHFNINKDYYKLNYQEARSTNFVARPNSQGITLLTERGYYKIVKSFTDEISWEIQDMLIDGYFQSQEIGREIDCLNIAQNLNKEYIDGKFTELQNQINNLVLQRKTETLSNITEGFNTNNPIQNFFQSIGLDYKTKEEWQNDIKQIKYTEDEILKWKTKQKAKLNDFRKAHKDFKLCTSSLFLSEIYNTMKTKYDISMEDYEKGSNKKRLDIVARDDKLRECFELSIKEVFENPENFYKPNVFTNIETEDMWRNIIIRITSVILFNDTNKAIKYHFNLKEFLVNEFCASLFEENLSYLNAFNKIYTSSGLKYELENFIIKYYNDILKDRASKTIEEFVELLTNNTELYVNFMFGDEVIKF